MAEHRVVEWKRLCTRNLEFQIRKTLRLIARYANHLIGHVDADHVSLHGSGCDQACSPARSATNIQHRSIRGDLHLRDSLLANRPMPPLHAVALSSACPFVEFDSQLLVR